MAINPITTIDILNLGDDQLSSQAALVFTGGIPGGGNSDILTLRMDQNIDPPEEAVETYDVWCRGIKVPFTSMTQATDKQFQVQIRIDQNWETIKSIETWYHYCYDPKNATALSDSLTRTSATMQYYNGAQEVVKLYQISGLKIKAYKIESSEMSSPDPLRATLTFIYTLWYPLPL